jgi:hypothetical protein
MRDVEMFCAFDGESLFAPGLVPFQIAEQTVSWVIYAVFQSVDYG